MWLNKKESGIEENESLRGEKKEERKKGCVKKTELSDRRYEQIKRLQYNESRPSCGM
jgi:hypothetical protein